MSEIADILDQAADRLSKPGAWIRGPFAINSAGNEVDACDHWAVAWCAAGALTAAAGGYTKERELARQIADSVCDKGSIIALNERADRPETVVSTLRQAAAKARSAGK